MVDHGVRVHGSRRCVTVVDGRRRREHGRDQGRCGASGGEQRLGGVGLGRVVDEPLDAEADVAVDRCRGLGDESILRPRGGAGNDAVLYVWRAGQRVPGVGGRYRDPDSCEHGHERRDELSDDVSPLLVRLSGRVVVGYCVTAFRVLLHFLKTSDFIPILQNLTYSVQNCDLPQ